MAGAAGEKRDKILFAKLAVVFLFTVAGITICNLIAFGILGISESIVPLVDGGLTVQIFLRVIKTTIISAVTAAGIGVVATGIGFIKKSVPTTIVSAVLLSSLFCNIMFNAASDASKSDTALLTFTGIVIIAGIISALLLMKKVNYMEV